MSVPHGKGLPDRRAADGDRREQPGAGYGKGAALDPHNRRVAQRRDWKRRKLPRRHANYLGDPMHPDDEAEMTDFLAQFPSKRASQ